MAASSGLTGAGIILIFLTGLVHFYEAPGHLAEEPALAYMFILNGVGALVAALGIYKKRVWGWALGLFIAVGAVCGYIISRTIGMPGMMMIEEVDAVGVAAVIVETLFTLAAIVVLFRLVKTKRGASAAGISDEAVER